MKKIVPLFLSSLSLVAPLFGQFVSVPSKIAPVKAAARTIPGLDIRLPGSLKPQIPLSLTLPALPTPAALSARAAAKPLATTVVELKEAVAGRVSWPQLFDADKPKALPAEIGNSDANVPPRLVSLGMAVRGGSQGKPRAAAVAQPAAAGAEQAGPSLRKPIVVAVAGVALAAAAALLITDATLAWVVAGVVLAGAMLTAGILYKGAVRGHEWAQSAAFLDSRRVEDARRAGDDKALGRIASEVDKRSESMQAAIRKAEASGSSTLDDPAKTPVATAKRLVVYDSVAWAKARLYQNVLAKDPADRMGSQPFSYWRERLTAKDQEARASGFEGHLLVELRALAGEMSREQSSSRHIESLLESFEKLVPAASGGAMQTELDVVRREFELFNTGELGAEASLGQGLKNAVYARVNDRFYRSDPEFKRRSDRRDRLQSLLHGALGQAMDFSVGTDQRLQDVVMHLQREREFLVEASRHVAEDQSGPYREQAAAQARLAAQAARAARDGLSALYVLVPNLHADPVILEEQLEAGLPSIQTPIPVEEGAGGTIDQTMPPAEAVELVSRFVSSAQFSRDLFAPIPQRLSSVRDTVAHRQSIEAGWVSGQVQAEMNRQEEEARKR